MKLIIQDLNVCVGEKKILNNISVTFETGKHYCILWKNGSGKSTLFSAIMGHPNYNIVSGKVFIAHKNVKGEEKKINILKLSPDQRLAQGIFLSFQHVPEIPGIRLGEYLRTIYTNDQKRKNPDTKSISPLICKKILTKFCQELDIHPNFLDRDLYVGFSGGEKRKVEMLQMKLLQPHFLLLDEIDSGLDVSALKNVAHLLGTMSRNQPENRSFVFITHRFELLQEIEVTETLLFQDGEIVQTGGKELLLQVQEKGF